MIWRLAGPLEAVQNEGSGDMKFLRFMRRALRAYWRFVTSPLTEEEQEEILMW